MKKKKLPLIALILIGVIGIVGGTIAFFTSEVTFPNIFKTKKFSTYFEENFKSPDNWLPGTTTEKEVIVTNNGNVEVAVRVSYEEKWESADGTPLPLTINGSTEKIVELNYHNNLTDWITKTEKGKTYYYYKRALKKDQKVQFLDSVTYSSNVEVDDKDMVCTTTYYYDDDTTSTTLINGKVVVKTTQSCNSSDKSYAGATYTLTITIQTIQYNAYEEGWETDVTITNS